MGIFDKMGDMMDLMGKLKETQKQVDEVKNRLNNELRTFYSKDEQVKVVISVSGEIKDLQLQFRSSSDEFTHVLKETLNKAYSSTKDEYEKELAEVAKSTMPKIPGIN